MKGKAAAGRATSQRGRRRNARGLSSGLAGIYVPAKVKVVAVIGYLPVVSSVRPYQLPGALNVDITGFQTNPVPYPDISDSFRHYFFVSLGPGKIFTSLLQV